MNKETLLNIASWIEMLLGAYFVLAFAAWFMKIFFFSSHRGEGAGVLLIPIALAVVSFVFYFFTRRALNAMTADRPETVKR
jgi:hypothetical protein